MFSTPKRDSTNPSRTPRSRRPVADRPAAKSQAEANAPNRFRRWLGSGGNLLQFWLLELVSVLMRIQTSPQQSSTNLLWCGSFSIRNRKWSPISMDWFRGKLEPETIDFPIKFRGFSCKFSQKPIHWPSQFQSWKSYGLSFPFLGKLIAQLIGGVQEKIYRNPYISKLKNVLSRGTSLKSILSAVFLGKSAILAGKSHTLHASSQLFVIYPITHIIISTNYIPIIFHELPSIYSRSPIIMVG